MYIFDSIRLYLAPFTDTLSLILILATSVWSIIVVATDLHKENIPDITVPFGIITATLGFILPLQMSSALDKNKDGINLYNAFCGDVMALAWQVNAVIQKDATEVNAVIQKDATEVKQEAQAHNKERSNKLSDIFIVFPTAVKWRFRGDDFKAEKLEMTKQDSETRKIILNQKKTDLIDKRTDKRMFIHTDAGKDVNELVNQSGLSFQDAMFYVMFDKIAELKIADEEKVMLFHTAERIYSSYGNMDNMKGYHAPKLFNGFLNSALIIYVALLPFSFDPELEYNILWQAVIVIYFFLGICVVTKKVANPFVSSKVSRGMYQTVGETETGMNEALLAIKATREVTQKFYPRLNWA